MCGILGYFSTSLKTNPDLFVGANNLVNYRGPDSAGYSIIDFNFGVNNFYHENKFINNYRQYPGKIFGTFGFRRLSIIDLSSAGNQPMTDYSGFYSIVFNGEIYNFKELKQLLIKKGYIFKNNTDTEVILNSYKEWGSDCLSKFNGMFAFCIVDSRNRSLFCARDRLGIKPFYYLFNGQSFIFASEIKQLLHLNANESIANDGVLLDYLYGSYGNETENTFFRNVNKIEPASFLKINLDGNSLSLNKYSWWKLPEPEISEPSGYNDKKEELIELFKDSINLRLRSDVPVGTCLSGGLDSSGIVGVIKKYFNIDSHKVFTIQSPDALFDETDYAKEVSKMYNLESFYHLPSLDEFKKDIRKLIWHHDEPLLSSSMYGGYLVYKLAKNHGVTVVLDGQGADELLGGYQKSVQYLFLTDLINQKKIGYFLNQVGKNSDVHNSSYFKVLFNSLKKFLRIKISGNLYSNNKLINSLLRGIVNDDFIEKNIYDSNLNYDLLVPDSVKLNSFFKKDSYLMLTKSNLPGILRQVDRNSMAHSTEARIPFLDYRIVEFLFKLHPSFIMKDGYSKYIFRDSMKEIIPESIRLRLNKFGFAMPDFYFLSNNVEFLIELLNNSKIERIFNYDKLINSVRLSLNNYDLYNPVIWRIINLHFWYDIFINKNATS